MKNDRTENRHTLRTIGQRGGTKFDNIQRTLLEHPAKKLNFRDGKLFFLSSGGAAAFLHNLHVAPLDAGDPIQCSRPAARPPRPTPPERPSHTTHYNIILYTSNGE